MGLTQISNTNPSTSRETLPSRFPEHIFHADIVKQKQYHSGVEGMTTVTTEKELAQAIKSNQSTITITGDLSKKTLKIHATGSVAWAVVAASLIVAGGAAFVTMGSGGTATPVAAPTAALAGAGATSVLGIGATTSAISVILASGGVAAGMKTLKSLRKYKVVEKSEGMLVLNRR
ncbi:hypothetical protein [Franconibacter daqui]|uniref:hypothetical protein n=1 Tax=Franconibacter daqui TaxID=2047724 RepID=UPI002DBCFAA7|nr:hypothetical protein [Franconibacter daqui]MEB5924701.1 hypothetical protein [Franconibacter daqui]